jgi:hypothetical protein
MFADPLPLIGSDVTTPTFDLGMSNPLMAVVTDPGAQLGRTVRQFVIGALSSTLIISRSETKENKPYGTKRINVRLSARKVDTETGNAVEPFVQFTYGLPKGLVSNSELRSLAVVLLKVLLVGPSSGSDAVEGDGDTFHNRLMAGEG